MFERDNVSKNDIMALCKEKIKNIIVLTDNEKTNLPFSKIIKPNPNRPNGLQFLDKDKYGIRTIEKQWNFVDWLNQSIDFEDIS